MAWPGERYERLKPLGQGGMGEVWLARDRTFDRLVAVKLVLASAPPELRRRLLEEARAQVRLRHANVVQVLECGEADGQPFVVFEYVEGTTLSALVAARGPRPEREVVVLGLQLCAAMAAVHAAGILHRDLKSDNVLLSEDGTLKVADFGLARRVDREEHLTATGVVLGTPSYMAPELIRGEGAVPASDVYAAGAILYELSTGRTPFASRSLGEILSAQLLEEPRNPRELRPELGSGLAAAVVRALAKRPEARFASFEDLARALEATSSSGPLHTTEAVPCSVPARRRGAAAGAGAPTTLLCSPAPPRRPVAVLAALACVAALCAAWALRRGGTDASVAGWARSPTGVTLSVRAQRVEASWRSATPQRFRCALLSRASRRREAVRSEKEATTQHVASFTSLRAGTPYLLVVTGEGAERELEFDTPPAVLERGVFACATDGALFADFATNLDEGVTLSVRDAPGRVRAHPCAAGSGSVVVTGLRRGPVESYGWELSHDGQVLAAGSTSASLAPFLPTTPGTTRPSGAPLWFGERFVFGDQTGSVTCVALTRRSGRSVGTSEACRPAWRLELPGQRRVEEGHVVGSLTRVGTRDLVYAAVAPDGTTTVGSIDVDRAQARQGVVPGPSGWHGPAAQNGAWTGGREASFLAHRLDGLGLEAVDPSTGPWRSCPPLATSRLYAEARRTVLGYEESPADSGEAKGWLWLSNPLRLGEHVVAFARRERLFADGSAAWGVAAFPMTGGEPSVALAFRSNSTYLYLAPPLDGRTLWVAAEDRLCRLDAGARVAVAETVALNGLLPSERRRSGRFGCPGCEVGGLVFLVRQEPDLELQQARFSGVAASMFLDGFGFLYAFDPRQRRLWRHEPAVTSRPESYDGGGLRGLFVSGLWLVGFSSRNLFVVELATKRAGCWSPPRDEHRILHCSVNEAGLAAVLTSDAAAYLVPLPLVVAVATRTLVAPEVGAR